MSYVKKTKDFIKEHKDRKNKDKVNILPIKILLTYDS